MRNYYFEKRSTIQTQLSLDESAVCRAMVDVASIIPQMDIGQSINIKRSDGMRVKLAVYVYNSSCCISRLLTYTHIAKYTMISAYCTNVELCLQVVSMKLPSRAWTRSEGWCAWSGSRMERPKEKRSGNRQPYCTYNTEFSTLPFVSTPKQYFVGLYLELVCLRLSLHLPTLCTAWYIHTPLWWTCTLGTFTLSNWLE